MKSEKIIYLVSQYPAPSHTFIRREILALQNEGLDILPVSINKPGTNSIQNEDDIREQKRTVYLKSVKPAVLLGSHFKSMIIRPCLYFKTLFFAMKHRAPGLKNFVWSFFYFAEALILADIVRKKEITHIHNHFANASANVGLFASKLSGVPWSLTLHGLADWTYPSEVTLAEKLVHADFVACVSYYGRAQANRISSPDIWNKMIISRCGIDTVRFNGIKQKGDFPDKVNKPWRIISIGRLSPEKGHSGLISSFKRIIDKGLDVQLVIGGDGPCRETLENQIRSLELQDKCFLLGQLTENQVIEEMSHSDLFVLSSFMEGLPVVLMEALSLKLPVIAPYVAGIPELIIPGETGLLFIPGDWNDLTDKILEMVSDRDLAKRTAESGYNLVRQEYSIEKAVLPKLKLFKGKYQ